ncbi:MAG: 4Fe-4S dicluster domain-containing protein [Anaerolineales bacterium]|jgi:sulfhydrogenase subunit beta (sulfur reductase)
MMMPRKILPKAAIPEWVDQLRENYRLMAPRPVKDRFVFAEVDSAADFTLDYPTTILPPKKALLPPRETLIRFDNQTASAEPILDPPATVILGVHTCDLHAIALLDEVFTRHYADQHYLSRRESLTIVSVECLKPCSEEAFCKDMDTLNVPDRFDLHLTNLGDAYAVDIGSQKGEALLQEFAPVLEASPEDQRAYDRVLSNKWSQFSYRLQAGAYELPSTLNLGFKSTLWEELGERCLGCGLCNLVCPTCYCFDIQDETDFSLNVGERYRVWDSCQLSPFAVVAGGHDFRPSRAERLRHRFLRKYRYQTQATGMMGCVGCGRCAQACLVEIAPIEVLNTLYRRCLATERKP